MECRIAARKSHLARLQALTVGRAIQAVRPDWKLRYEFRESLGDKNATDPLWKMPEKGVFTQDFVLDLLEGRCDLVVHSWKDLPLDRPEGTRLVATMPRADSRDLLLVVRSKWAALGSAPKRVEILTSSPRRSYNLEGFLKDALPGEIESVSFTPVRGNIPTRLKKLLTEPAHGLIVAKAAIDRLLRAGSDPEFAETAGEIREVLNQCHWMALPLAVNPAAAAQGALAIEASDRTPKEILEALREIDCPLTFAAVEEERRILHGYGGGCHQKIGVSVLNRPFGRITLLRGQTDAGEVLDVRRLESGVSRWPKPASSEALFASAPKFFEREAIDTDRPAKPGAFWVARADAWPEHWVILEGDVVWTAGLETWRKLAERGVWVNGSAEGLGEREDAQIDALMGAPYRWTKLSHEAGIAPEAGAFVATYRLKPKATGAEIFRGKTHFFWKSGSSFERALEIAPDVLRAGWHFCGPGHTAETLAKHLGAKGPWAVMLDLDDWLAKMGPVEKV